MLWWDFSVKLFICPQSTGSSLKLFCVPLCHFCETLPVSVLCTFLSALCTFVYLWINFLYLCMSFVFFWSVLWNLSLYQFPEQIPRTGQNNQIPRDSPRMFVFFFQIQVANACVYIYVLRIWLSQDDMVKQLLDQVGKVGGELKCNNSGSTSTLISS